jgi:hypothetical protein
MGRVLCCAGPGSREGLYQVFDTVGFLSGYIVCAAVL